MSESSINTNALTFPSPPTPLVQMVLDKDGPGRVRSQGKLGIFKRNQAGLRIPLCSHASGPHFMCLFTGLLSHRRDPGAGAITKPSALGSQALPPAPGSALRFSWKIRLSASNRVWNKWLAVHEVLGGKGSSRIRLFYGLGCATVGPGTARELSQHCPSSSAHPPGRAHLVWADGSSQDPSAWEMISQFISVSTWGLERC